VALRHNDAFVLKFFPNDESAADDGDEEEEEEEEEEEGMGKNRSVSAGGGDRLIDRVTQFLDDSRRERDQEREREREREREIPPTSRVSSRGAIRHNFIDYRRIAEATERPSGSMRRTGT